MTYKKTAGAALFDTPQGNLHPTSKLTVNFSPDNVPALAVQNPGLYWEALELFNTAVWSWTFTVHGEQAQYDLEREQSLADEAVMDFHEKHPEYNLPDAVTARVMERMLQGKDL